MVAKIWFITGASRGFGREWTIRALERGDSVAATARNTSALDDLTTAHGARLLPIQLDVTDRDADFAAVKQAHDHFGRLDVVINNAGYGHFEMVEELSEQDARNQLETNLFGALWVTQAALPFLRAQGRGHIIQVSSIGGITAFPMNGAYHASKWALEGLSQALSQEVADFGINVTLVEPGGYATDWAGPSSKHSIELPAYNDFREKAQQRRVAQRGFIVNIGSVAGISGNCGARYSASKWALEGLSRSAAYVFADWESAATLSSPGGSRPTRRPR